MKILLILAALTGSAFGFLNYPFEYKFDYEGIITMGLPEIRSELVGTGIRGQLVVQSIDRYTAVAQLQNVQVGENIDTACEGSYRIEMKYKPVEGKAKILEEPFEIHAKNQEGNVMIVTKGEEEWVTNIRKSIAFSLNLHQLHKIENLRELDQIYGVEQTLYGKCDASYTVVPPARVVPVPSRSSEGANRTLVIRNIDFDSCRNQVLLSQASIGNLTKAGHGQFSNVQSRSSVGRYQLENFNGEYYDIRQIVVEGSVITNPYGYTTEKMVSMSNQTFYLKSKHSISSPIRVPVPSRTVTTWNMEVASPFAPSSTVLPWMNFKGNSEQSNLDYLPLLLENSATGINLTEDLSNQFAQELDELVQKAAKELVALPSIPPKQQPNSWKYDVDKATYYLDGAVSIARGVTVEKLQQLLKKYHSDAASGEENRMREILLIDILAASGNSNTIKVLLDAINDSTITDQRAASIFMTLANNLRSTTVLNDLLAYAKTLDLQRKPYLAATVWINFASTLNRVCLNPYSWKYTLPWQIYGSKGCHGQQLLDDFLPFLKQNLESYTETWQRAVVVQALNNLGTPQTLHVLNRVIMGEFDQSVRLRTMGLYALVHSKMIKNAKEQVFQVLMPLISDMQQPTQVRQVALLVALTWHPSPSIWHRLALIGKQERGREMGAFVYFVTESYAKATDPTLERQAKMAQFVRPIMKPYMATFRYSYENAWAKLLPKDHMITESNLYWLDTNRELFPREFFFILLNNMVGCMHNPIFEVRIDAENRLPQLLETLKDLSGMGMEMRETNVRDKYQRYAHEALNSIKEQLKFGSKTGSSENAVGLNVLASFFDTIQLYVPINEQVITKVMGPGGREVLAKLAQGHKFSFTKFIDPVQIEVMIPTDIGLPLFSRVSTPTISVGDSYLKLNVQNSRNPTFHSIFTSERTSLIVNANYKLITKISSTTRVLVPWSMQLIATGVDSLKDMNLPARFNITYSNVNEVRNISLSVVPQIQREFPVAHIHNLPFVMIKRMWPAGYDKTNDEYKTVTLEEGYPLVEEEHHLNEKYSGVKGRFTWAGDAPYPFTRGWLLEYAMWPQKFMKLLASPTAKLFAGTFYYDIQNSETKEFHTSIALVKPIQGGSNGPFTSEENRPIGDKKVSEMFNIVTRSVLNGTQSRYFEGIFSYLPVEQSDKMKFYAGVDVQRSPLPGYDSKTSAYCLDLTTETPRMQTYEQLMKQLRSNQMDMTSNGQITGGVKCRSQKLVQFEGKFQVSHEREQLLKKEMNDMCNTDPIDPLIETDTSAVYDLLQFDFKFDKNAPQKFLNASYNFYDVVRGFAFPHSYFNYMNIHNPEEQITIRGNRIIPKQRWYISAALPTENINFSRFWLPSSVADLIPIGGIYHNHPMVSNYVAMMKGSSKECRISPQESKVVTYDGTTLPFEVTPCQTIVAIDKSSPSSFAIRMHRSPRAQQSQLVIVSPKYGMNIEMTPNKFEVNGSPKSVSETPKTILTQSGLFFGKVVKSGEGIELIIPGNVTIKMRSNSEVVIRPSPRFSGSLAGLCGGFNGKQGDLMTPSGQVVEDREKMQYSWTLPKGEGCDSRRLHKEKEELERTTVGSNYRGSFESRPERTMSSESKECVVFVYPVRTYESTKGKMICISKEAVPRCHPKCEEKSEREYNEDYICFDEQKAPKEVLSSLRRGYTKHFINVESQQEKSFPTKHVNSCRRR